MKLIIMINPYIVNVFGPISLIIEYLDTCVYKLDMKSCSQILSPTQLFDFMSECVIKEEIDERI